MKEARLQMDIFQALQARGIFSFSVANEALGKIRARSDMSRMVMLKSMGLRSGVSDLIVVLPNRVVFMEVKTQAGTQSENQKHFQKQVESLGHTYSLVRSVEEAVEVVASGPEDG